MKTITPGLLRRAAVRLVLALLAVAGGVAFAPAFGGDLTGGDAVPGLLVAAVLTGALVPALVVAATRERGYPVLPIATVALVLMVVGVVVATRPGTAVAAGPYRLLTSALPADPTGPGTAAVGLLTGFASLIAVLIADFARYRALAVVPPLVVLLAALALDAGVAQPPAWYAAVVLVLTGGALVLLRDRGEGARAQVPSRTVRIFPLLGAGAILAVAAVLGSALASDLPGVDSRAADARQLVSPPLQPRNAANPLQQFPAFARGVQQVRLTGTTSRRVPQLTLVTLPQFDGQTWTSTARFRRAGSTLRTGATTPSVTVDVTAVDAREISWLLRPDRPTELSGAGTGDGDLGVDEATGDIVVPGGVTYPKRYRVTGGTAVVEGAPGLATDRAVAYRGQVSTGAARVPKSLRSFALRATAPTAARTLAGLQNLLRNGDFYLDDSSDAKSGNGFFQLDELLTGRGRRLGTSEQYASAFAVMARLLGYDSRVVMGFTPRYARDSNRFTVTGRDVRAWPQVRFAGAGWVTYDPTPGRTASRATTRQTPAGASPSPSSSNRNSSSIPPPTSAPTTPPRAARDGASSGLSPAVLTAIVVVAIVVLLLATPPGVKVGRRRRRRGAAVPAHAVYGAWRDTADRLAEVGRRPQRGRSTGEVAADAPRPTRDDVRALGRILDRAGYAPESAGAADAQAAWRHADSARTRIRATMPRWRRLLAALDPRPLWRR